MSKISFFIILEFIVCPPKKRKVVFALSSQPQYMDLNFKSVDKWYQKKKAPGHVRCETSSLFLTNCFCWVILVFKI